jgi:protocatechuate 3,4-dioxygenase beta subunit
MAMIEAKTPLRTLFMSFKPWMLISVGKLPMQLKGILCEMLFFKSVRLLLVVPAFCSILDMNNAQGVYPKLAQESSIEPSGRSSHPILEDLLVPHSAPSAKSSNNDKRDTASSVWDFPYADATHLKNATISNMSRALETLAADTDCNEPPQPEAPIGPYYVSGGHPWYYLGQDPISQDIISKGCPMTINIRIIDVNTCKNATDVWVELWHADSQGVYSGIVSDENSKNASNVNNTMFRGFRYGHEDGFVQFATYIPGHQVGRTTHIKMLVHPMNTTLTENQTISNIPDANHKVKAIHVGEIFFEQQLIDYVNAIAPYKTNTQAVTRNDDDEIYNALSKVNDYVVNFMWIDPEDTARMGIFAWVIIGVNTSNLVEVDVAGRYLEAGGIQFGAEEATTTSTSAESAAPTATPHSGASRLKPWPMWLR